MNVSVSNDIIYANLLHTNCSMSIAMYNQKLFTLSSYDYFYFKNYLVQIRKSIVSSNINIYVLEKMYMLNLM